MFLVYLANHLYASTYIVIIGVREIDAEYIHPCSHHIFDYLGVFGSRA